MATPNYGWISPAIGAAFGAWGTILNEIFGGTGTPLGIDGVLKGIADEVDAAEVDLAALTTRVDTLEAAGSSDAFYARVWRSGNQTLANTGGPQQVSFNATSFDQGSLVSGASLVVPAGADGVYEIRAQIEADFFSAGDDARRWTLELHRNGAVVAVARTPHLNDGVSASSGDITLSVVYLDANAVAGTIYTVHAVHSQGTPALTGAEDATFMEAVRLIAT